MFSDIDRLTAIQLVLEVNYTGVSRNRNLKISLTLVLGESLVENSNLLNLNKNNLTIEDI